MFTFGVNHSKRKDGELSAYSIFNEKFQTLIGTFDAEKFERELRHNPTWTLNNENDRNDNVDNVQQIDEEVKEDVDINRPTSSTRKRRAYQERLLRRRNKDNIGEEEVWEVYDEGNFDHVHNE